MPASRGSCAVRACQVAFGPRHPDSARLYAAFIVVAAMVAFLAAAAAGDGTPAALQLATTVALGGLSFCLVTLPVSKAAPLCLLTPLIGAAVIVVADVATRDAGVAGQIFFCLPVLYAATQLRPAGALLVTIAALAGESTVVLLLLPHGQAVTDLFHVGTTLALISMVLIRAGVVHDRLVARLRQQAAIDPLTGLVTRRVLDEATRSAMNGADTDVGTSLVLIDVDEFKAVNDTYGHVVGDDVLSHIAGLLAGASRVQDVVARMGGDEFAVLMPGCGQDVAERRADQFVALVRDTPLTLADGVRVALSVSAGVANVSRHEAHPRTLYADADAALYAAKHAGRGRVGRGTAEVD